MENRKEKLEMSIHRRESLDLFKDEDINRTNAASTPVRINSRSEDEESPYFAYSTQEMREDVDVLWDYSSPQSTKPKTFRKSRKKLNLQQSPKVPLRRHPSNNNGQIKQDLLKLREDLRALRAEMAKPEHEESLILSPMEEEDYRESIGLDQLIEEHPVFESDFEDPFDDNMDEQLLMFSQQVENQLTKGNIEAGPSNIIVPKSENSTNCVNPKPERPVVNCDHLINQTTCNSTMTKNKHNTVNKHISNSIRRSVQGGDVFNDSFDNVLSQLNDDDINSLTQVWNPKEYIHASTVSKVDKKPKVFPRCVSEETGNIKSEQTNKVQWHRTQSFESYSRCHLSKQKMDEIERKRLEAKARLESKKKQVGSNEISDSPLQCSPDEIEKKRLQALAKLEAKRQKEFIEKKKQEALKRREESRKKGASQVKSSLSTRL